MRKLGLGCLLLLVALAGCSSGRHDPTEKYYLVSTNIKIPYWEKAGAGLVAGARQLGVQVEMVGPDTYDPQAEAQEFHKVTAKKPAGILVSVADPKLMTPEIDAAIAQGVPVITIDSDAPASKRVVFVGTNNYEAGLMGGRILAERLGGKGNVVIFTMPGQANLEERLQGYKRVFAEHPQVKISQIVDVHGDPRIAFDTTRDILSKGKIKPDGLACLEALSCKEVADVLDRDKVPGKVVIAMDTDRGTVEWIQKGGIAATIGQKPYTMAFYGLKVLDDLHHYKPASLDRRWAQDSQAPVPAFVDTGATLVDKSNVDQFLR